MRLRTTHEKLNARACRRIDFRLEITTIYDFLFMRDRNGPHRRYVRCVRLIRCGDKTVWPCGWLFRHPLNISSRKTSQMKKKKETKNTIAATLEVLRTTQSNWQFQFEYIFICERTILNLSFGFRFSIRFASRPLAKPFNHWMNCESDEAKGKKKFIIL